ncbi:YdcH family protein [Oceanicola sp. 22II-s10i]|uniref:YdcH family protein n=1 Tax=Oceanicola sp. 22II-s10i TaxID=1317116 RepID=UPI000B5219FA|nr:YdcH family protein [Oceanicola sp. 22II-s10i]
MSLGSHIEELKKKHQILSAAVDQAQRSPGTSDQEIRQMKKEKLRIKEQISRLS